MKEELLPCPFCGGEVASIIMHGWYYVYCKDCKNRTDNHGQKEHAIKAWNTRTTPDRWISVEEKPIPIYQNIVAGLYVENKSLGRTYWEEHLICVSEENVIIEVMSGEYFTDWELEDFTHWKPLPKPPEDIE